jgi:hypothetical protein
LLAGARPAGPFWERGVIVCGASLPAQTMRARAIAFRTEWSEKALQDKGLRARSAIEA